MPGDRLRRVNEAVLQVLSEAIASELQDPRIGFVTVTAVQTSPDLRQARVSVSVLGTDEERERSLAGLRSAHGLLQQCVAQRLRLKYTPTLSFEHDDLPERAARMQRLLEEDERP